MIAADALAFGQLWGLHRKDEHLHIRGSPIGFA